MIMLQLFLTLLASLVAGAVHADEPALLYQKHCVSCHGVDRLGAMGPALLPESLGRLKKSEAIKVVGEGRPATQMQAFSDRLDPKEIASLVDWIYTPTQARLRWGEEEIRASRIDHHAPTSLPDHPSAVFRGVDMMNVFVVVEAGDHHVSIVDGDRFQVLHRFPSRYALHGGPKFTSDGRYVFFASRDGWVSKFDLWNLKVVAEVRAGINTRNVAVSDDGKYVAVANYLPHTLVLLDGNLNFLRSHTVYDKNGTVTSRVSAVYNAAPRSSFVAALKDVPEVWEVSYNPKADDIPVGMIHDFQYKEGAFVPGFLNPRRTFLSEPLDDFFFTQDYSELMGASRDAGRGQVVNLDVRKKVADLSLPGMPHLGSGITWRRQGHSVMATPNLKEGVVSVIDMSNWQTVKQIPTPGPGFFMRGHEESRYVWTDSMMSKFKDTLTLIDRDSLEKVAELRPEPGKTLAHVEFTRDGKYVLASLWERKSEGGALIVYDARSLKEVKRLPMDKPVGKYNVWNKTTRSAGTSH